MSKPIESIKAGRLVSLDVFRGITIAGMLLVNNPGSWSHVYPPLRHAEWHGCTPTDLIFPFFLFIVGVAMVISFSKRIARGDSRSKLFVQVIRRSLIIFGFGWLMHGYPYYHLSTNHLVAGTLKQHIIFPLYFLAFSIAIVMSFAESPDDGDGRKKSFVRVVRWAIIIIGLGLLIFGIPYDLSTFRIPGVLQRIALCYFFASLVVLKTNVKGQVAITVALLLVYWALMKLVPVPGFGAGILEKQGNLAAYIDNALLSGHLWQQSKTWDPEGLLSTLPAIATTLFGVLTGHWIQSKRNQYEIVSGLFVAGCVGLALGWVWSAWFPLNKSLWTSSYSVYTAGMALCFLGVCYYLIDVKGYKGWTKPFVVYGMNAITVFVLSGLVARLLTLWKVDGTPEASITMQRWIYQNLFASWAGPLNGSLFFAIGYVLFWLGIMWIFYWRRIFIKI
ncbi:MAG: DUF5009 domain-containing protein [candidate division KSB1 bacterium]|nr:DUF5009 domain-containing protein [candidate division KSB1 bacterium]MDZ7302936.1 DUF5009 domain-containing protein [candidate division KSB1 bacterium]MDZ7312212.1 DUF5009 domain-containing protein [candidate division KSB1 bacterium]